MTEQYLNNPLHGLGLETLITELVEFYGFEILAEALNFNCFRLNPSIKGSYKFLKKTEWAREKIEKFYLYQYKNLPRPDAKQLDVPPRDRIIPEHQKPREPKTFTLEDLAQKNEEKAERARNFKPENKRPRNGAGPRRSKPARDNSRSENYSKPARDDSRPEKAKPQSNEPASGDSFDPWGQARKKFDDNK